MCDWHNLILHKTLLGDCNWRETQTPTEDRAVWTRRCGELNDTRRPTVNRSDRRQWVPPYVERPLRLVRFVVVVGSILGLLRPLHRQTRGWLGSIPRHESASDNNHLCESLPNHHLGKNSSAAGICPKVVGTGARITWAPWFNKPASCRRRAWPEDGCPVALCRRHIRLGCLRWDAEEIASSWERIRWGMDALERENGER